MKRPTPVKDAAVHRLAKSITQLTLCQVTTREVDDATKLLEKACQRYKTSHPKGSLTLKQPYASFARLAVYWIVVQYLPVTKYPKRRKPYCFLIIQPKEPVRHRKNSMHRFHHALMTSTISHTTKTTCKSTGTVVLAATAMNADA